MARKHILAAALVVALSQAIGGAALAAAGRPAGPPQAGREEIEDLRETVHLLMISRLKRELQLSEEQHRKIVPLLDEMDRSRQQYRGASRSAVGEIRRLLASADPAPEDLARRVEEVRELRRLFEDRRRRIEQEISRQLSAEQQARLIVFLQDFRQRMRARLERARQRGGMGQRPRPTRGRPPAADDDWEEEF